MTKPAKGALFIALPFIIFFGVLFSYTIVGFILNAVIAGETTVGAANSVARIIRVCSGGIGILTLLLAPVSIIYGVVLLVQKPKDPPTQVPKQ